MRGVLLAVFTLAAGLMAVSPASADRRIAFVVGNSRYEHTGALANPRNDAQDVADKLKSLGFEVTLSLDLDQASFAHAIDDFARRLDGADVGLFYYAGHALQMNEKNYLVSTNAKLESAFLVPAETIELEPIVRLMESKAAVNLVFLDACRNNPLADNLKRSLTAMHRSVALGRGLVRIEPQARDTLIAFAAAPGQEASDGNGRNSPFTAALLNHMGQPGVEVSVMLKEVAAEVREKTANIQRPQQLSDMSRTFYFAKAEAPATPLAAIRPPAQAEPEGSVELAFWRSVGTANDCESVRAYLSRFPNGSFTELARISEKRLCAPSKMTVATNEPANQPAPAAPPALASVPTPAVPAPPAATASQAPTQLSRLAPVNDTKTDAALPSDVVRNLQSQLLRVGCGSDEQEVDGSWSPAWQAAVRRFNTSAHATLDPDRPSADALASVQGQKGQVCPLSCGPGREPRNGSCVAKAEPSPAVAPRNTSTRSRTHDRREDRRHEATRHPAPAAAAAPSSERRTARSNDNPPPLVPTVPGNPYRESYTYVGTKRCKTFEPPGGAPRIICP
jgi:peptidoglycan hydrolase-like protein with peptidoglycan-binding domain